MIASGKRGPLICIALVLAVAAVYAQTLQFDFVNLDDDEYVYANPAIRNGLTADNVAWVFTSEHGGNWHPLTGLSHQLDCTLFGVDPGAHHGVNVLFHAANTLLLFGLLSALTRATWRSAFVAALFGLHPMHIESVAWISERKDVLSTFFWFLTTWAYVAYARKGGLRRYALVFVLLGLGLMAKPMLVTLPFTLLLLDYWALRDRPAPVPWKKLVLEKLPLLSLSTASCVVTFLFQQSGGAVARLDAVPLGQRIANAAVSYVTYIMDMFLPSGLSVIHPHPNLPGGTPWAWWQAAGAAAILLSVTALAVALYKRRYFPTGWFWYLGTLVPVIGLVQVGSEAHADRYTYVPYVGLFIIVAWGGAEIAARLRIEKGAAAAAVVVVAVLGVLTFINTRHWKNSISLFEQALRTTSNNLAAHTNLGYALKEDGRTDEAMEHFAAALEIHPGCAHAHNNIGMILAERNRIDVAIESYAAALAADPEFVQAHNNMGIALAGQGRTEEAFASFERALAIQSRNPESHYNLATLLMRKGRTADAMRHMRTALEIDPAHLQAHTNLGSILAGQGRLAEALDHFRAAAAIDSGRAQGHFNLGLALEKLGRFEEAAGSFAEALRLDPGYTEAQSHLEFVLRQLDRQP